LFWEIPFPLRVVIRLYLEQRQNAVPNVIKFRNAGAEHFINLVKELAPEALGSNLEGHEVATILVPEKTWTSCELIGLGVQAQLTVGKLRFHRFAIALLEGGAHCG